MKKQTLGFSKRNWVAVTDAAMDKQSKLVSIYFSISNLILHLDMKKDLCYNMRIMWRIWFSLDSIHKSSQYRLEHVPSGIILYYI